MRWSLVAWPVLFVLVGFCFWKLSGFLHWPLGRILGFRVSEEGFYLRSMHICQSFRLKLDSPAQGGQSETHKICCRFIYLKKRLEDKDSDVKSCMVRNVCSFLFKPGERIRVSRNISGEYKVEKIEAPA